MAPLNQRNCTRRGPKIKDRVHIQKSRLPVRAGRMCPVPWLRSWGNLTGGLCSPLSSTTPVESPYLPKALKDPEGFNFPTLGLHAHWATQTGKAGDGRGAQSSGPACPPRLAAGPAPHSSGHQSPAHICCVKDAQDTGCTHEETNAQMTGWQTAGEGR